MKGTWRARKIPCNSQSLRHALRATSFCTREAYMVLERSGTGGLICSPLCSRSKAIVPCALNNYPSVLPNARQLPSQGEPLKGFIDFITYKCNRRQLQGWCRLHNLTLWKQRTMPHCQVRLLHRIFPSESWFLHSAGRNHC